MTVFASKDYFSDKTFPFTIQKYTIQPNEVIPSHTHEFFELVFVEAGTAEHVMADARYELRTGDIFVIEPSVYHHYNGTHHQSATVYNVLFHLDFIRDQLQSLFDVSSFVNLFYLSPFLRRTARFVPHLSLSSEESARLIGYLNLLLDEVSEKESGYELACKSLLINLFVFLSRCCTRHSAADHRITVSDSTIDTIMAFIRTNYQSPLTVTHISKSFGMSVSSLLTKFKQQTGTTLLEYKHQVQIREACRSLQSTDDKIITIAHAVGFEDLSFFYRVFRRVTGLTPAQYRSNHQA